MNCLWWKGSVVFVAIYEEVMLCNKKIDQVDGFIYLDRIVSKDTRWSKGVKSGIVKTQIFFFADEKPLEK